MTGTNMLRDISIGVLVGISLCFAQTGEAADSAQQRTDVHQPASAVSSAENDSGSSRQVSTAPAAADNAIRQTFSLFAALDEGQIMSGIWDVPSFRLFTRQWQQRMYGHISDQLTYAERLKLILSFEYQLTFSFDRDPNQPATFIPLWTFYPNDVEISYAFGNLDWPWLRIAAGYFPYKYNPDVKHLGEFLLRSSAYPTVIVSNFEFAMTRELGFHLGGFVCSSEIYQLKWDAMLTSETHDWPLQDWTVSLIASNNLFNFFDLGAGISLQRLISVDESKTTPHSTNKYYDVNGDSAFYSFSSTKVMARASLNPKRFIPDFRIPYRPVFGDKPFFGNEDLKIYGELAVLGTQDYVAYDSVRDTLTNTLTWQVKADQSKNYYNDEKLFGVFPKDRTPYMVGINLPTNPLISYGILPFILTKWLKDETGSDIRPLAWITLIPALASGPLQHFTGVDLGMDVTSLEFEWISNRFANSNLDQINGRPLPYYAPSSMNLQDIAKVKYAYYFKKSFLNNRFAISGIVSRDQMRPPYHGQLDKAVTDDFLQRKQDWWWTLRLSANF